MFAKLKHLAIVSDQYALLGRFYEALFGMKPSPDNHPALDRQGLLDYTRALEALGFLHVIDYSVRHPGPPPSNRPPRGPGQLPRRAYPMQDRPWYR